MITQELYEHFVSEVIILPITKSVIAFCQHTPLIEPTSEMRCFTESGLSPQATICGFLLWLYVFELCLEVTIE